MRGILWDLKMCPMSSTILSLPMPKGTIDAPYEVFYIAFTGIEDRTLTRQDTFDWKTFSPGKDVLLCSWQVG